MPTQTTRITISLPQGMARRVEAVRKAEQRTRSGLMQEALRYYFSARMPAGTPEEEATAGELRAIARGRADVARGNYVTLDKALSELHALDRRRRGSRPKIP